MKTVLYLLLFFFIASLSFAQNKGTLAGKVIDSAAGQPIERATVAVMYAKDSTLISYTVSAKDGQFSLYRLPLHTDVLLNISHISFGTYEKVLQLDSEDPMDLGAVGLAGSQVLDEVLVVVRPPIRISKDTITFDANAFKVRPNAVIEDLLMKLPGVQVDVDGTVSVNGKVISKILLDNKEFFSNDVRILTKNFDADLIDEIQIMDDKGRNPDRIQDETNLPKIMNLKLKKAIKHSSFGKFYAGTGTNDRYEAGALANFFRDTLQVSFIGFSNNVNRSAFDYSELQSQGGFNRGGASSPYSGGPDLGGRAYGSIQRATSAGININNNWSERRKANLMYFYGDNKDRSENTSYSKQFLDSTTLSGLSSSAATNRSFTHNLSGLIEWEIDTMTNFRYVPRASFSDGRSEGNSTGSSRNAAMELINDNTGNTRGTSSTPSFSHEFNFYRRLRKKGESLSLSHSLQISDGRNDNWNYTDINIYGQADPSSLIDQQLVRRNGQRTGSLGLQYQYPISASFSLTMGANGRLEQYKEELATLDFNDTTGQYDLRIDRLSSDLHRKLNEFQLTPGIFWQINPKANVQLGLSSSWQQVTNTFGAAYPGQNNHAHYFFPRISLSLGSLHFSYSYQVQQPLISQLSPVVNDANPLSVSSGNPLLKPSRQHSASFNYSKYFTRQQLTFFVTTSVNYMQDATANQRTVNQQNGAQSTMPVNLDGNYYSYSYIYLSRALPKMGDWSLQVTANLSNNLNSTRYILNTEDYRQVSAYSSLGPGLFLRLKDVLSVQQQYAWYWQRNSDPQGGQSLGTDGVTNLFNQSFSTAVSLRWPEKVNWEISYAYRKNGQVSGNFNTTVNMVNMSIGLLMLKKDRGEVRFKVYDLLDQNNGFQSYGTANYLIDYNMLVLKRYFLLSYVYKFNHVSSK